MIEVVEKGIVDATEDIIAHQVNCLGEVVAEITKRIMRECPATHNEYLSKVHSHMLYGDDRGDLLGSVQITSRGSGGYVVNMFGQHLYGGGEQQTDIGALTKCFITLRIVAEKNNLSVALPYGVGNIEGGADWSEVFAIIEEVFDGYGVTIYKG